MAITSVRFTSQTGGDDKDNDTGVFVRVLTQDQQTLIASIDNACERGIEGNILEESVFLALKEKNEFEVICLFSLEQLYPQGSIATI